MLTTERNFCPRISFIITVYENHTSHFGNSYKISMDKPLYAETYIIDRIYTANSVMFPNMITYILCRKVFLLNIPLTVFHHPLL
jgi:hypothetical protein